MKKYQLKIDDVFGKEYLKVFLSNIAQIQDIQSLIKHLPSVRRANITESSSKSNPKNLTVYPNEFSDVQEMMLAVEAALEGYFSAGTYDPIFVDETIPLLSDTVYFRILDYLLQYGNNLEKYPRVTSSLEEEGLRDHFLPFLNTVSRSHSATGETFNKLGRTDILIQDAVGANVFIAECKLWNGRAKLKEALDQLLDRYVNWRDEKVALVVFSKSPLPFSEVIRKANQAVSEHPHYLQFIEERKPTSFSYVFKHPDDPNKKIKLELMIFNYSSRAVPY